MATDRYISLIYKELESSITPDEHLELSEWSNHPANAKMKSEIEMAWCLSEDYGDTVSIDLDNDFAVIKNKIQSNPKSIAINPQSRNWMSIAAGAAILVAAFWGLQRWSTPSSPLVSHTASEANQYYMLEDGSEIYLQEGSSISYLQPLDKARRTIHLSGEAIFHVAHDGNWPLDVKTLNETITVLGTKFHIVESKPIPIYN